MNKIIAVLSFLIVSPFALFGQKSIQPSDLGIHTQLTFLSVHLKDVVGFEECMGLFRKLSKKAKLEENFDWLTYRFDTGKYLIINFSDGLANVMTLERYRKAFYAKGVGERFDSAISNLAGLDILVERNYVIQMLLPRGTVNAISVAEFPLATMAEYKISVSKRSLLI